MISSALFVTEEQEFSEVSEEFTEAQEFLSMFPMFPIKKLQ